VSSAKDPSKVVVVAPATVPAHCPVPQPNPKVCVNGPKPA